MQSWQYPVMSAAHRKTTRRGVVASPVRVNTGQSVSPASSRKSALKRRRIIDAAAKLFCERGYAEIRMSDIAAEAGTQSGAMYYYFDSKESLVEEFLRTSLQPHTDFMRAALQSLPAGVSWRERIETAIRAHLERALERDNYTMGFIKIFDQVPPAVRERFAAYPKGYAQVWRELVDGAVAAGELRDDLDPVVMRNALMGSLDWTLEWYQPGRLVPAELAAQMAQLFLDGMSRRPVTIAAAPAEAALLDALRGSGEETVRALGRAVQGLRRFSRSGDAAPRRTTRRSAK
jgi:AcrR family transcriptional regulator